MTIVFINGSTLTVTNFSSDHASTTRTTSS